MRYLGTTVERFTSQINDIQLANRASEARIALQQHEFRRQQDVCGEMMDVIEKLRIRRSALTQYKLGAIQDTQKSLLSRLDRVLQALMEKASPELSEHEKKWFQELRRMKGEVAGVTRYDERSLAVRTSLVSRFVVFLSVHPLLLFSFRGNMKDFCRV
jgi:nucleoporin NUP82